MTTFCQVQKKKTLTLRESTNLIGPKKRHSKPFYLFSHYLIFHSRYPQHHETNNDSLGGSSGDFEKI